MNETLESRITDLISIQVPDFIREEYPNFVSFMEAYYEWMETKFNRELVSASDGIPIRFVVDPLTSENKIILDNLTLERAITINSYLTVGSYITTNARYKENRGPLPVSEKELVQLSGDITLISDIVGTGDIKIRSLRHNLGYPGDEVELTIEDTTNYNGRYTATIIDTDNFSIGNNFITTEYTGKWSKNYITIWTDDLISDEIVRPNTTTIDSFLPGSGVSKTKLLATNHNLTNNNKIVIVNSPDYSGEYVATVLDEQYLEIDHSYSVNNVGAYFVPTTSKIAILSFEFLSGQLAGKTAVHSLNHGLKTGDIVTIVDSPNYDGTYTITVIDVDYFEISATYVGSETDASWLLPSAVGPVVMEEADWLGVLFASKKILNYSDVDETIDAFMTFFMKEFLPNIPVSMLCEKNILLKNIKKFYKARGTEKSWKLLFRILFNESVSFYYPSQDILRTDDGKWYQNQALIVKLIEGEDGFLFDPNEAYLNKRIIGKTSLATGLVQEIRQHWNGVQYIYEIVFEKNSVTGTFVPWETLATTLTDLSTLSVIQPIFQDIVITNPGLGYTWADSTITITTPYDDQLSLEASINLLGPGGEVLGTIITNHSLGYPVYPVDGTPDEPVVIFVSKTTPNITATGKAIIGATINYEGKYLTQDGFLDDIKKLRDDYFYQEFSYVAKTTGLSMNYFKTICKKLVHPAGLMMFARVLIETHFETTKVKFAEINPNNKVKMVPFGRTILGKELFGYIDPLDSTTFKFERQIWQTDSLVGLPLKAYKKPTQTFPETSFSYVLTNQYNTVTVNPDYPLRENCDALFLPTSPSGGGSWFEASGLRLGDTSFQTDQNLWPTALSWNSLTGKLIYSYQQLPDISYTTHSILSNTNDTIVVDSVLETDCDTIQINDGVKEYYGTRVDDTTFRIFENFWPINYLQNKNLVIHSFVYNDRDTYYGTRLSITEFQAIGASWVPDELIGRFVYSFLDTDHALGIYSTIVSNTADTITVDGSIHDVATAIEIFNKSGLFANIISNTENSITVDRDLYPNSDVLRIYEIQEEDPQNIIEFIEFGNQNVLERIQRGYLYSTLTMESLGTGSYLTDELVYQGTSFDLAIFKAKVISYNISSFVLILEVLEGDLSLIEPIRGTLSFAVRTIASLDEYTVEPKLFYYGSLPYNRRLFTEVDVVSLRNVSESHVSFGSNYRYLTRTLKNALPLPMGWPYYDRLPKVKGTRTSDFVFTKDLSDLNVWIADEFIGKRVWSYVNTDRDSGSYATILDNDENTLTVDVALYAACDRIEVEDVNFPTYQSSMEERVLPVYSGTRIDGDTFTASGTPFNASSLEGYAVFSSISSNPEVGAYSIVASNTTDTINVTELTLYPGCDQIRLEQIPIFIHYKDVMNIELQYGVRTSDTLFTVTGVLVPDQLVGKKLYSYVSGDKYNRHLSLIISNTEDTITVLGDLFPLCDMVEIVLVDINNYWNNYANYQINTVLDWKISDFQTKLEEKTIICPEPRIYQFTTYQFGD